MQFTKISLCLLLNAGITSCSAHTGPIKLADQKHEVRRDLHDSPFVNDCLPDWREDFAMKDSSRSYSEAKAYVLKLKQSVFSKDLSADSLGNLFTDLLVFHIIPYWYGTPWTFEGHTAIPNQGEIACGYFVSTTLLHAGLNVNRYKLAQQLPVHEAASLVQQDSLLVISESTTEKIVQRIDAATEEGVYFLGFDQSHVGFLFKRKSQLFLIHSNYVGGSVIIEKIEESAAFSAYRRFYICPLSTNQSFLRKWQKNEVITVVETP